MAWYNFYMNNDPNAPLARECHSIHTYGTNLLLFGGNNDRLRMDDVHILNTITMQWSRIPPMGDIPIKRSAHSSTLVDNRYMYVFGGWDGSAELGDLSIYDIYTQKWTKPKCLGIAPVPRHFHNTIVVGRKLFIFGGYDGIRWRNDIGALNLDTNTWEPVNCVSSSSINNNSNCSMSTNDSNTSLPIPNTGEASPSPSILECPGPRASSSCVVINNDKLLIFGGYNGDDFLNDMWILHTKNPSTGETQYRWEQIKPQSLRAKYKYPTNTSATVSVPPASSISNPISINTNVPYQPGTVNTNPSTTLTSSPTSSVPSTTNNASNMNNITAPTNTRIPSLIYTSNLPNHYNIPLAMTLPNYRSLLNTNSNKSNDFSSLNSYNLASVISNNLVGGYGYWPTARSGHAAEIYGNLLLIFGGRHKQGRFNDILIYNLYTGLWYEYIPSGIPYIPRKTHAVGRINNRLWLFGGHDGTGWLGDLLMLDLQIIQDIFTPRLTIPVPLSSFSINISNLLTDVNIGNTTKNNQSSEEYMMDTADNISDDGLEIEEFLHNTTTSPKSSISQGIINKDFSFSSVPEIETHQLSASPIAYSNDISKVEDPVPNDISLVTSFDPITKTNSLMQNNNDTFTDVAFLIQGKLVRAHKSILSLRCEYFRIMFTSIFSEATATIIPIPDIDIESFRLILQYIYTDTIPLSETLSPQEFNEICIPLLIAAQRFSLLRLSRLCQRYIEYHLTMDNVCEFFELADTLHLRPLRRVCIYFILDRYNILSRSPSFIQLRSELLRELLHRRALYEEKRENIEAIHFEKHKSLYLQHANNNNLMLTSPPAGSQQPQSQPIPLQIAPPPTIPTFSQ